MLQCSAHLATNGSIGSFYNARGWQGFKVLISSIPLSHLKLNLNVAGYAQPLFHSDIITVIIVLIPALLFSHSQETIVPFLLNMHTHLALGLIKVLALYARPNAYH